MCYWGLFFFTGGSYFDNFTEDFFFWGFLLWEFSCFFVCQFVCNFQRMRQSEMGHNLERLPLLKWGLALYSCMDFSFVALGRDFFNYF